MNPSNCPSHFPSTNPSQYPTIILTKMPTLLSNNTNKLENKIIDRLSYSQTILMITLVIIVSILGITVVSLLYYITMKNKKENKNEIKSLNIIKSLPNKKLSKIEPIQNEIKEYDQIPL